MIGDHVKGGLHGAQPSLTNLDDDGNLVPTVDFRPVYANVLHAWLQADDHAVLGKTSGAAAVHPGPAAPFTGTELGYWLAGPKARCTVREGTKFGSVAHTPRRSSRAPRRRRTTGCGSRRIAEALDRSNIRGVVGPVPSLLSLQAVAARRTAATPAASASRRVAKAKVRSAS